VGGQGHHRLMIVKQPSETKQISVAFGVALSAVVSVVITSRALISGSALPTASAQAVAGSAVTLLLAGGTDGERYQVTVRASTAAGETRERDTEVAVIELGWETPAAGAYLPPAALIERAGIDIVTRLTDEDGLGRIDAARLAGALADAAAEIDAHVSARYALPLSQPWPLLATIAYDLALARLWQARGDAPDGVTRAAGGARAQLKLVADGKIAAPAGTAPATAEAQPQPVLFQPPSSRPTLSSRALRGL
jgi:phage gp36-like protein